MTSTTPLLSIIVTSYNHEKYIGAAIKSLLDQNFKDFELIVVDDASSDDSLEVIKNISDDRIKLISLEKNRGVCTACNLAMQNISGKYVKLFASDDIALPDTLGKQIKFLEENQFYDAVFSGLEVIDEAGNSLPKKTKRFEKYFTNQNRKREEWLNHFFFKGNSLAAPTMMMKTDLMKKIGGFDARLSQAHDFDMWVKCCLNGANIHILNEKLLQYRRISNNKNLSSNTSLMRKRLIFDNEKILENYLSLTDVAELVKIFPDLEKIKDKITENLIPFFIAKEALKVQNSYFHTQFAINVIHKILANGEIREKLENEFGFILNRDFFEMVAKNPIGNLSEEINRNFCIKIIRKIRKFLKC